MGSGDTELSVASSCTKYTQSEVLYIACTGINEIAIMLE